MKPPTKPADAPRKKAGMARWKETFLSTLHDQGEVTKACAACGKSRATVYRARQDDPEFREAWEQAREQAIDDLEDSMLKRAREGWLEPVYYKGVAAGVVRKFSAALSIFMLKANRPGKYHLELQAAEMAVGDYWARIQDIARTTGIGMGEGPAEDGEDTA